MNPTKQFTGFLSSVSNPGDLSLTIASFTKTLIWLVSAYAVVKGVDAQPIVNSVQQIMALVLTAVTAGFTLYHAAETIYGLIRKVLYALVAKPVVTVAVATPVAVTAGDNTLVA